MNKEITWEIMPMNTPRVIRNCNKCKCKREFYSSDLFRVNGQKKCIDVWLIYKCSYCDSTWNQTILSRVNVNSIGDELHEKYQKNNKELAWEHAFDMGLLKKSNSKIIYDIDYTVSGKKFELSEVSDEQIIINVKAPYLFDLHLHKILRKEFGISRRLLSQFVENNVVSTIPEVDIETYKIKENLKVIIDGKKYSLISKCLENIEEL